MSPGLPEAEPLINFAALIRQFWPKAMRTIQKWEDYKKDSIALAALADSNLATRQDTISSRRLTNQLCQAWLKHGNGKTRNFVSLGSKALWLCYPDKVPIYDAYAKRALCVVAKREDGVTSISHKKPEYEQFVHIWKQLYAKYKNTIKALDIGNYPHRVRVVDRILWLIGQPYYSAE